jgi:hypothetical protein
MIAPPSASHASMLGTFPHKGGRKGEASCFGIVSIEFSWNAFSTQRAHGNVRQNRTQNQQNSQLVAGTVYDLDLDIQAWSCRVVLIKRAQIAAHHHVTTDIDPTSNL